MNGRSPLPAERRYYAVSSLEELASNNIKSGIQLKYKIFQKNKKVIDQHKHMMYILNINTIKLIRYYVTMRNIHLALVMKD